MPDGYAHGQDLSGSAARPLDWAGRAWAAVIECFRAEQDRWTLWLPVAFGAGIAVYFGLPDEPPMVPDSDEASKNGVVTASPQPPSATTRELAATPTATDRREK